MAPGDSTIHTAYEKCARNANVIAPACAARRPQLARAPQRHAGGFFLSGKFLEPETNAVTRVDFLDRAVIQARILSLFYVSDKALPAIHFLLDRLAHPTLRAFPLLFGRPGDSHFECCRKFETDGYNQAVPLLHYPGQR